MNKIGDITVGNLVFISLVVVYFGMLFVVLYNVSSGAVIYEKVYAKQISLLLDNAKADTQIEIDFSKGIELVEKKKDRELNATEKDSLVSFGNNQVTVSLSSGSYSYYYLTNYEINSYFDGNKLILMITWYWIKKEIKDFHVSIF